MNITQTAIPILLVDDRSENLMSLEQLLSNRGYELVKACSGNEALLLTLRQDFALVLMDVQMPDMDGFETAELMRAHSRTRHIPIIFVTAGMKDLQFQFKGYDSGAVDYLAKPIEPLFLQSKVRIFAEMYRQRHEIEQQRNHLDQLRNRLETVVNERTEKLRQSTVELTESNKQLSERNRELKAIEDELRHQIQQYVETHDHLLATEEMLRVQIEEYAASQKLLRESNSNLQTIFDVSPFAIVVSSFPDGKISQINRTFSTDFEYSAEHVAGKTIREIGIGETPDVTEHFLTILRERKSIAGFETEMKTAGGEKRAVLLYGNLMWFHEEESLLLVFLDVTVQKRLEDQLRQNRKMEVIGQLAGGVAHDFNNMLSAIMGSTELLANKMKENPDALKYLNNIERAAIRSAELTRQLLTFSRKGQKKSEPVNTNAMIKEVISLLERTIDRKIVLETRLVAHNTCIAGDATLLQNALLNLGINARDAMPDGGVITFTTANVELDSAFCGLSGFSISPGPYIEVSVSDSGKGMTKEIIEHIFEPYFTTKEKGKGTGLGLAAVYGSVTSHNGCIKVYSEPGIGT
ncbi:MAG: response regulator, partial [Desulfuromonadales bacterium]